MPREVRLIRRISADSGGFSGDNGGGPWSEASPPVQASPHETVTNPIFVVPIALRERQTTDARGAAGIVRVLDDLGNPSLQKFTMKLFVEWLRIEGTTRTSDWRALTDAPTRAIGNGEDWTTDPVFLQDQRIAFHLVPIGGSLPEDHVVEIWGAEI